MTATRQTVFQRIVAAAKRERGLLLTEREVRLLARLAEVQERARADDAREAKGDL